MAIPVITIAVHVVAFYWKNSIIPINIFTEKGITMAIILSPMDACLF